jgi:hypothetical protein
LAPDLVSDIKSETSSHDDKQFPDWSRQKINAKIKSNTHINKYQLLNILISTICGEITGFNYYGII